MFIAKFHKYKLKGPGNPQALDILGKRIKWLILPLHESETDRHLIGLSG